MAWGSPKWWLWQAKGAWETDDAWSSKWSESGWKGGWWETKDGDGTTDVDMSPTKRRAVVKTPVGATPKHRASPATAGPVANDGDIPMENDIVKPPTTYEDEEWEEETEAVIRAKSLFWGPEKLVRLQTGALTPFEVHQLKESYPMMLADINKVIKHFGESSGPTRAARTVLKTIAEAKSMVPGTEVSIDSPEFSICKHLLLGAWDGMPIDVANCGYERCNCFPRTSLMPKGCPHNAVPLWKVPFYYSTLCRHCSECVRCGGYLGNILLYKYISSLQQNWLQE